MGVWTHWCTSNIDPGFATLGAELELNRVSWATTVPLGALRVLMCVGSVALRSRAI